MGYLIETKSRKKMYPNQENKIFLEKQMIHYYKLSTEMRMYQAYNQIGSYFLDPEIGGTPESYLLIAQQNELLPAYNNLINLYRKQNSYAKCVQMMELKYRRTSNIQHLIDLMNLTDLMDLIYLIYLLV